MLIGSTVSVTGGEGRSKVGTASLGSPTVSFASGTATITFNGNSGLYSFYRVQCLPVNNQVIYSF